MNSGGGGLLPKGFWPLAGVCVAILLIGVFMQAGNPIEEYGSVRDRAAKFYKTDLKQ